MHQSQGAKLNVLDRKRRNLLNKSTNVLESPFKGVLKVLSKGIFPSTTTQVTIS